MVFCEGSVKILEHDEGCRFFTWVCVVIYFRVSAYSCFSEFVVTQYVFLPKQKINDEDRPQCISLLYPHFKHKLLRESGQE